MKLASMVSIDAYVVCSSYAHSLGVYSIPFETINFNPATTNYPLDSKPRTNEQPNKIQGNIVTTKADKPKPIQNKINPMLIDNTPKPFDQSTTIIATSSDTPMNLDMNSFLGHTISTKNDLDIMNEVLFGLLFGR